MYNVKLLNDKRMLLVNRYSKSFTIDSIENIISYMLSVGFLKEELDYAISNMNDTLCDSAEFGIRKLFLYSYDSKGERVA